MIVNAPSKFNFRLLEMHLYKHPIALPIPLAPLFMEQGKLADHLSEQGRKSFYVEPRCMGLWHWKGILALATSLGSSCSSTWGDTWDSRWCNTMLRD